MISRNTPTDYYKVYAFEIEKVWPRMENKYFAKEDKKRRLSSAIEVKEINENKKSGNYHTPHRNNIDVEKYIYIKVKKVQYDLSKIVNSIRSNIDNGY